MASSGIRLGAWDYLRWGHIRPIEKDGKVVAAKIIVYAGEEDEYFSFISAEAYKELKSWMDYRSFSGETINEDSWLMRDLWDTGIIQGKGFITKPNRLAQIGIKKLINRAMWAQGLRKKLEVGKKRHPFQAIHCYRKVFKSRCEIGGMKPINVEKLLSHSIGISNSYYRPTENELLEDYLKVSDLLQIDQQGQLQKELHQYQQKNQEDTLIIKGKMQERDEDIEALKKKHESDLKSFEDRMERRFQQLLLKIDVNKLSTK
jgi:hypothetical protein